MSDKTALIVGHQGQDGRFLSALLLRRGYRVVGIGRSCVDFFGRPHSKTECAITDPHKVTDLVESIRPDEIYYLAAYHRSSEDRLPEPDVDWRLSYGVNAAGVLHFLEAIRKRSPASRLFYASSSHIFGANPIETPQTEITPPSPSDSYGVTKLLGTTICEDYRSHHGIYASIGILYNHESELRREGFLTSKIVRAAIRAQRDGSGSLRIGDLEARVDWGYAPDFVDAFTRILALPAPDTYVIATGETHSVKDFAQAAFAHVGLEWSRFVHQDRTVLTRPSVCRIGSPMKLMRDTGWHPTRPFPDMVAAILDAAIHVTTVPLGSD